jgi:subtilisin family serine protease
MRRSAIILVLVGASLCLPAGAAASPPVGAAASAPARAAASAPARPYVVVFNDSVATVSSAVEKLQARLGFTSRFRYASALKGFAARLTEIQTAAVAADPAVDYVAPDTLFHMTGSVPLASGETLPVGTRRIGAATTSQVKASSGVNVAVLDTGSDLANPDLNAVSAVNCVKSGSPAKDDNGHGTNVAGIIAARDQGSGVVGVAPGTRLYAIKVLDRAGSGTLSEILCGINWVTANAAGFNIKVANMSLTGSGTNDNNCGNTNKDAEHQAICRSVGAGVTYVTAAGNNGASLANYIPASYPEVLTATAMTDTDGIPGGLGPAPCVRGEKDDTYATYSNYAVSTTDQAHTIAAPGTCVVSDKLGGGLSTYNGTSQAAPHVAATVALCFNDGGLTGVCAGLTPAGIISQMRSAAAANSTGRFTGDPLHPVTGKYYGYLDAAGGY